MILRMFRAVGRAAVGSRWASLPATSLTLGAMLALGAAPANAITTVGYVQLSEVKAFDDRVMAYPADGQEHQCSSTSEKTAFRLDPAKKHLVALLYLAYVQRGEVSLEYDCEANGLPYLRGVRVRP